MTRTQCIANYNSMTATELYQIYGRFSRNKALAFERCKELQYRMNGYGGRVKSCGTAFFTYAFKYMENGIERLMYMTGKNTYDFPVE